MVEFRKGMESLKEAAEKSNFTSGGRRYFKWEPGEEKTIRFLTEGDAIVVSTMHEFVTCHDGSRRSFVCRQELDSTCELCATPDVKKKETGLAVGLWRVPVKKDGKTIFSTKTDEVEVDGALKAVPWVGILQQSPRNFWRWFWSAYEKHGTLLDRDYSITRQGKKMDTVYNPFPEDVQALDLSKFEEYIPDLEEYLSALGSKEYYDKWLHGIEPEKKSDDGSSNGSTTVTDDDLASLRAANEEIAASAVAGEFD